MGVYKRGTTWHYEFIYAGKRIRESANTTRKWVALEAEKARKLELERALAGISAEPKQNAIRSVSDLTEVYLDHYKLNHRPKSVLFAKGCLAHVTRLMGTVLLPDLTEKAIRDYMRKRLDENASGRTINAELGELSRAVGKPWKTLWPKVRKMEEQKDLGKALSPEEEDRLLRAASRSKSRLIYSFMRVALATGMRYSEILALQWGRVNFEQRVIQVGRTKTEAGSGRDIPMNAALYAVLGEHAAWFTKTFGDTLPTHYVFPFGIRIPNDPTRSATTLKKAWENVRDEAKVACRFHDLRHTACTKLAEAGVSESTMLSLMGHMSRKMLERYSHIRMAAKREAVEAMSFAQIATNSDRPPTKVPTNTTTASIQ